MGFFRFFSKWRRRGRASHLEFVMYTRQGCCLCQTAWQMLEQAQRRRGFVLRSVDIDTDPDLVARYGTEVPVVTVNGKVRFRGEVNRVLLERLLEGEAC